MADSTDDARAIAPTIAEPAKSRGTAAPFVAAPPENRYQLGRTIGRGGMGEVVAATDAHIGREVAIKRLHAGASSDGVMRFLREARVQARLEHPAIVPVHEMSVDREGRPFFVMKRLQGTTLSDILRGIRDGDTATIEQFPRQRLRAFTDACLAVEFAHQRWHPPRSQAGQHHPRRFR
jgi:serine/threonine-protein kinase